MKRRKDAVRRMFSWLRICTQVFI